MVDQQTALLGGIVLLATLVSVGSYYAYQWLASAGWRSPLPWFVCGLAIVVLAIGFFALIVQLALLSRLHQEESTSHRIGFPANPQLTRLDSSNHAADQQAAARPQRTRSKPREASSISASAVSRRPGLTTELSTAEAADSQADPSRTIRVEHYTWLEDQSFWGATRCVLAVRQDPEDAQTWILINECQGDVRILVASCNSALEYCYQRGSRNWSYVRGGMNLPAKVKRSVSAEEQTVHGLHLRYAACRTSAPMTATHENENGALRHIGVQSCSEEVRTLSEVGAQSGSPLEEVVNEPVPANPCCQRQFVQ